MAQNWILGRSAALLENINKVRDRESANDWAQWQDERIIRARDEGLVNQLALNTALLEFCREMEAVSAAVINSGVPSWHLSI